MIMLYVSMFLGSAYDLIMSGFLLCFIMVALDFMSYALAYRPIPEWNADNIYLGLVIILFASIMNMFLFMFLNLPLFVLIFLIIALLSIASLICESEK